MSKFNKMNWVNEDQKNNQYGTPVSAENLNRLEVGIETLDKLLNTDGTGFIDLKTRYLEKQGNLDDLKTSVKSSLCTSAAELIDSVDSIKNSLYNADQMMPKDRFLNIQNCQLTEVTHMYVEGDTYVNYLDENEMVFQHNLDPNEYPPDIKFMPDAPYITMMGLTVDEDMPESNISIIQMLRENVIYIHKENAGVIPHPTIEIGQDNLVGYIKPDTDYWFNCLIIAKGCTGDINITFGEDSTYDDNSFSYKCQFINMKIHTGNTIIYKNNKIIISLPEMRSESFIGIFNPMLVNKSMDDPIYVKDIKSVDKNINLHSFNNNLIDLYDSNPVSYSNKSTYFAKKYSNTDINEDNSVTISPNEDCVNYGVGWMVKVQPNRRYKLNINLKDLPNNEKLNVLIQSTDRRFYNTKLYRLLRNDFLFQPTLFADGKAIEEFDNMYFDNNGELEKLYYEIHGWQYNDIQMNKELKDYTNQRITMARVKNTFYEDTWEVFNETFLKPLHYEKYTNINDVITTIDTKDDDYMLFISITTENGAESFDINDSFTINSACMTEEKFLDTKRENNYLTLNLDRIMCKVPMEGHYDSIEYDNGRYTLIRRTKPYTITQDHGWYYDPNEDEFVCVDPFFVNENTKIIFGIHDKYNFGLLDKNGYILDPLPDIEKIIFGIYDKSGYGLMDKDDMILDPYYRYASQNTYTLVPANFEVKSIKTINDDGTITESEEIYELRPKPVSFTDNDIIYKNHDIEYIKYSDVDAKLHLRFRHNTGIDNVAKFFEWMGLGLELIVPIRDMCYILQDQSTPEIVPETYYQDYWSEPGSTLVKALRYKEINTMYDIDTFEYETNINGKYSCDGINILPIISCVSKSLIESMIRDMNKKLGLLEENLSSTNSMFDTVNNLIVEDNGLIDYIKSKVK